MWWPGQEEKKPTSSSIFILTDLSRCGLSIRNTHSASFDVDVFGNKLATIKMSSSPFYK